MAPRATPLRLLLLGAGHAHLEVLRRIALQPLPVALTVVAPEPLHLYSGMIPGYLRGTYGEEAIAFHVDEIVRQTSGTLEVGKALSVDRQGRAVKVALSGGGESAIGYDLLSVAIGSDARGLRDPQIGPFVYRVKPFEKARDLRERLVGLARQPPAAEIRVTVVGGGAAGVEIALAAEALLGECGATRQVTIVDAGTELLADYSNRFRRRALRLLAHRGIATRSESRVETVGTDGVSLAGGAFLPSHLTVWSTGPAALPLFHGSGLSLDAHGFLLIDDSLRSVSDPRIFAAGDCATLVGQPETPKAGVYAVRQGPVLWRSLRAAVLGETAPRYRAQRGALSILNTADGRALLRYGAFVSHSRWAFRLKDRIDRRFVERYR